MIHLTGKGHNMVFERKGTEENMTTDYVPPSVEQCSSTTDFVSTENIPTADIMLIKYNGNGFVQWARTFGGIGNDKAYAVEIDGSLSCSAESFII
jgi:hypothetical protein